MCLVLSIASQFQPRKQPLFYDTELDLGQLPGGAGLSELYWLKLPQRQHVLKVSDRSVPIVRMLRCLLAGLSEQQQLQSHAASLLQLLRLHQQLPCIVTTLCQQQAAAVYTTAHSCCPTQQQWQLPQQQKPSQPFMRSGAVISSSGSSRQSKGSPRRQTGISEGHWRSSSSDAHQQALQHVQHIKQPGARSYSMATGHAHYHARHSGIGGVLKCVPLHQGFHHFDDIMNSGQGRHSPALDDPCDAAASKHI